MHPAVTYTTIISSLNLYTKMLEIYSFSYRVAKGLASKATAGGS
jgi:hypothetical protein